MPEKTSAIDQYLAAIDRLLDLQGRERRRTLALTKRRLSAYVAEARKSGACEVEAEERALDRLGTPQRVAEEIREWALTQGARVDAQAVAAAVIPILLATVAIAFKVLEVRRFRFDGEISISTSRVSSLSEQGFFRHFHPLDLYLPPRYLTIKLALSLGLVAIALVLAEIALAFVRGRRRLNAGLTLAGGAALAAAVSLQVALAFEWHRLNQGHDGWLLAAIMAEAGTMLVLSIFLARAAKAILVGRLAPLARAPMLALVVLAALLTVGAKSGLHSTDWCTPPDYCGPSPEEVIGYTANHVVNVTLASGPAGAQGAIALKGRRLAAVIEAWRVTPTVQPPPPGPTDLVIWEGRWSASQLGPCGMIEPGLNGDVLAARTNSWCDVSDPVSHGGTAWKEAARFKGVKVRAVAIAYRSSGSLAVAYSNSGGVWLAVAPSWRPLRVLGQRAVSIKLVSLENGDLALAAIVSRSGYSELKLIRSYGRRWSRTISETARPGLFMVSGTSQVALLFRDDDGHLVLERRTKALALLERKTFVARARGALGNLRDDAIGVAIAAPLRDRSELLEISRIDRRGLELLTRERLLIGDGNLGHGKLALDRDRLIGVSQTGEVVRALYAGFPYGHIAPHVAMSIWLKEGRVEFAPDWPRWGAIEAKQEEMTVFGKPPGRWTAFDLTLGQPPERQLAAIEAKK